MQHGTDNSCKYWEVNVFIWLHQVHVFVLFDALSDFYIISVNLCEV